MTDGWERKAREGYPLPAPSPSSRPTSLPKRTLLGFLRRAARLRLAAHHQNLMTPGVDDLRTPVAAQPQPEVEAAAQPFDERDLAVAVQVPQRRRHLAVPRELDRAQRGEEKERDGKDEDEGEQEPLLLQDSTR